MNQPTKNHMMQRRQFIQNLSAVSLGSMLASGVHAQTQPLVEVWKDPSCGCCKDWITHMQANGFQLRVSETGNNAARARLGIPEKLGSCHTALVNGYAIEGHVPAKDIQRLLIERPKAIGLAVPGMPVGSPGMDGAVYGGRKDPYDVLLVLQGGKTAVFQAYRT